MGRFSWDSHRNPIPMGKTADYYTIKLYNLSTRAPEGRGSGIGLRALW